MKKLLLSLLFLTICILGACQPAKSPDYRETPIPTDTELCGAAEVHLKELCKTNPVENDYCCMASQETKRGKSFTKFCVETQEAGIFLNPVCLSQITKCEEIDYCLGTVR